MTEDSSDKIDKDLLKYLNDVEVDKESVRLFLVSANPASTSSSSPTGGGGGISASSFYARSLSLADWTGTIGANNQIPLQDLESQIKSYFQNISTAFGTDNWMQLCKIIAESNEYPDILCQYVLDSEKILFKTATSTFLKDKYTANWISQFFYNLIRFHVHAKLGEHDIADSIITEMYNEWSHTDGQHQASIIYFCYINDLALNKHDHAIECFKRFYMLLKTSNESTRHTQGLWDDWVAMLIITWFVCKNNLEFERFFALQTNSSHVMYQIQRKRAILNNLSQEGLEQLITKPFYEKIIRGFQK